MTFVRLYDDDKKEIDFFGSTPLRRLKRLKVTIKQLEWVWEVRSIPCSVTYLQKGPCDNLRKPLSCLTKSDKFSTYVSMIIQLIVIRFRRPTIEVNIF